MERRAEEVVLHSLCLLPLLAFQFLFFLALLSLPSPFGFQSVGFIVLRIQFGMLWSLLAGNHVCPLAQHLGHGQREVGMATVCGRGVGAGFGHYGWSLVAAMGGQWVAMALQCWTIPCWLILPRQISILYGSPLSVF